MARLIFILAIFLLIWLAYGFFRRQMKLHQQTQQQVKQKKRYPIKDVKPCALCGLHIPENESIKKDELYFCSYQHLQEYKDKQNNV